MNAKAICLWSGPRNVSTALMYSFAQLPDVRVVDEPLYGHYLRVTGVDHPGRSEVMASMNCDGNEVMEELIAEQRRQPQPRIFLKSMAHHLVELGHGFLSDLDNVLLVRDPREMLPSLVVQLPNAGLADTGLEQQWRLFSELDASCQTPAVLDARELLLDPPGVLGQLCDRVGIRFDPCMLSWTPGPRPEDGVWAPYWYQAVHQSNGFAPYRPKSGFPAQLERLLAECTPWYERLFEHAIRASTSGATR